jgi:hypothetical protein
MYTPKSRLRRKAVALRRDSIPDRSVFKTRIVITDARGTQREPVSAFTARAEPGKMRPLINSVGRGQTLT